MTRNDDLYQNCIVCGAEVVSHNAIDTCSKTCFDKRERLIKYENTSYDIAIRAIWEHYDGSDASDPEVNQSIEKAMSNIRRLKQ